MTRAEVSAEMYRSGATLREIAAAVGKNPAHIRRYLIAQGVELRPPGRRAAFDAAAAQAMINHGMTQTEIARQLGVTPAAISAAISIGRLRKRGAQ